jgi:hypothetical protein
MKRPQLFEPLLVVTGQTIKCDDVPIASGGTHDPRTVVRTAIQ